MRPAIVIIAATVVIGTTFVLRAETGRQTTAATTLPGPAATASTAPPIPPVPEADAVEVALRAVRSTGDIARAGFISRDDLIASIASVRFAPTLRSAASAELTKFTTAVGAAGVPAVEVVWEELPLASHVIDSSPSNVRVAVWSVLIIGVPDHGAARQVWRTSTIDLIHETNGWKIDAWTAAPGPTPTLATSEAISDLASIVTVLAWLPTDDKGKR